MRLRNEIFAKVLDWLIKERKVVNQKDLALKTGITQTTISRIMKGKVEPEDETLRKLNNAFDNIFNLEYLRGKSTVAFAADNLYFKEHPTEHPLYVAPKESPAATPIKDEVAEPTPAPFIPSWADTLISIMTEQIKQNEALNRELRQSIAEVNSLKSDLAAILHLLKN